MIKAKTISDAWYQILHRIYTEGYSYKIDQGSFEGETRIQLPYLAFEIEYPSIDKIPTVPQGCPAPTIQEYVDDYFVTKIMGTELDENETYSYGTRINYKPFPGSMSQLERAIDLLKNNPMSNQAVIEIGAPDDSIDCYGKDGKYDPPCLRTITFNYVPAMGLNLSCFFRSWDAYSGIPTNLGGLELLLEYVCGETNLPIGRIYGYSSGAHVYGFQVDALKIKMGK